MSKATTMETSEWRSVHDPHRTPGFDHAREDAGHPSGDWVRLRCTCGATHTTTYQALAKEPPTLEQILDAARVVD